MRNIMLSLSASAAALGAGPAAAEAQRCTRGSDVRTIEAITPGVVGAACDLNYLRGSIVSTPYHADNSAGFCAERAKILVDALIEAGFDCMIADGTGEIIPQTEEERSAALSMKEEIAPPPAERREAVEPYAAVTDAEEIIAPPPAAAAVLEQPSPPALVTETELDGGDAAAAAEDALSVPDAPQAPASRGPVALSTTNASVTAPVQRPLLSAVGRLVGPGPDERLSPPAYSAPAQERLPAPPAAITIASAGVSANVAASVSAGAQRPPQAIIKNVLAAQVAAWNEGDLGAFMGGYWNSPDLRFVSGTTVYKGWAQTLKRYRDAYGEGAPLGRLSLDKLDVQMATDDVAIIVGRYNLARDAGVDAGAFTLVMKRFDGLWRIIHDHSVADPPPTE